MHESRTFPRAVPRVGKKIGIWFGENAGNDRPFEELRKRWKDLVEKERMDGGGRVLKRDQQVQGGEVMGILSEELKYGREAQELRMECAMEVRKVVLRLRRQRGLLDEDPKQGLVETWREEGPLREGRMKDDSWVKDM